MRGPSSFPLAVCAEMVFRGRPTTERVGRIDALGFALEIWDWTRHDIADLEVTGARFPSMTGYTAGTLGDDAGADELLRTAAASIPAAHRLGIPRLNLHGTRLGEGNLIAPPRRAAPFIGEV